MAAPGRPDNRGVFRYLLVLSSTVDPPAFFWIDAIASLRGFLLLVALRTEHDFLVRRFEAEAGFTGLVGIEFELLSHGVSSVVAARPVALAMAVDESRRLDGRFVIGMRKKYSGMPRPELRLAADPAF